MEWLTHWHFGEMMRDALLLSIVAHLIRTIPPVGNQWAAWIIGGLQFFFTNYDKLREVRTDPKPQDPPRG